MLLYKLLFLLKNLYANVQKNANANGEFYLMNSGNFTKKIDRSFVIDKNRQNATKLKKIGKIIYDSNGSFVLDRNMQTGELIFWEMHGGRNQQIEFVPIGPNITPFSSIPLQIKIAGLCAQLSGTSFFFKPCDLRNPLQHFFMHFVLPEEKAKKEVSITTKSEKSAFNSNCIMCTKNICCSNPQIKQFCGENKNFELSDALN